MKILCKIGIHKWQKKKKQWMLHGGKVVMSYHCENCQAIKGEKKSNN
jgi:hypothetical protein